jgi:hypothetical protein
MDNGKERVRSLEEPVRERTAPLPGPSPSPSQPQRAADARGALSIAATETFSMDMVSRFFDGVVEPQGNTLVSELVDENGPLAGRESARGRRRPGGLAHQFSDDDRPMLFAPNDAPDQLPQQPTELDSLLRQQEFRERRRFTV